MDLHIDDFYKDVSKTWVYLYQSFPSKCELFVEDICGYEAADEFGLHSRRHMACLGAFLWLEEEGFIRHQGLIRQEGVDQAILTSRSFLLLAKPIVDLDEMEASNIEPLNKTLAEPAIDAIRAALKEQSTFKINRLVSTLLAKQSR